MKLKKLLGICLIVVLAIATVLPTATFAFSYSDIKADTSDTKEIADVGNDILSIIRILGMIFSVGVIMILGIKYMMGSTEEKAEYKKTMIPYLVGAVLIFAATFIVGAIEKFAK